MYKQFTTNITPFGGLTAVNTKISHDKLQSFINQQIGKRHPRAKYSYADIILSLVYTTLAGGSAVEDTKHLTKTTLRFFDNISAPSPDVILRGLKELATQPTYLKTPTTINKIVSNDKLNKFLLRSILKLNLLEDTQKVVLDFDSVFLATEKYDAEWSYKKQKGYFPSVASINDLPFYIEGRNGNVNPKTEQLANIEKIFELLERNSNIRISSVRMDSAFYNVAIASYLAEKKVPFYIRAIQSGSLLMEAASNLNWQKAEINYQEMEVTAFPYKFGKHTFKMIAYRFETKEKQLSLFTGDAKTYLFLLTNDPNILAPEGKIEDPALKKKEKKAIIKAIKFYNQRGNNEKLFDKLKNDFNWKRMPYSFLEENVVYLAIMAFAYLVFQYLLRFFSKVIDGLDLRARLKKFIFKVINIVAKFTRSGRRKIIHLATPNKELISLLNSL